MDEFAKYFNDLTSSEQRVFTYIYNSQKEVVQMKITDLADATFTSKTVIINMAQKLGFSGFADLKYYLRSGTKSTTQTLSYDDLEYSLKDNIEKTFSLMNAETMRLVTKQIIRAKTVYVVARGTSKSVGYHLEHLLLTIGIKCVFLKDYNLISIVSKSLESDECVILLSLSGNTDKMVEIANMAKARGAKSVSLTSFTTNSLSKIADYKIYCSSEDPLTKNNDSMSRIGMFIIVELLVAQIKQSL